MLDFSKLNQAVSLLRIQVENFEGMAERPFLTEADREAIRDSVVKRFEFVVEMSWKALKKHMEEELGFLETPSSPKPVLRFAAENGALPGRIEDWIRYVEARQNTSHDYSGEKARAVLELAPLLLRDSEALCRFLTRRSA